MPDDTLHRCSICQQPAYSAYHFYGSSKADDPAGIYDIGCATCGEYRIGVSGEETMPKQSVARKQSLVRLIKGANARGNRYCINDGRETALSTLNASSAAQATRPPAL